MYHEIMIYIFIDSRVNKKSAQSKGGPMENLKFFVMGSTKLLRGRVKVLPSEAYIIYNTFMVS